MTVISHGRKHVAEVLSATSHEGFLVVFIVINMSIISSAWLMSVRAHLQLQQQAAGWGDAKEDEIVD